MKTQYVPRVDQLDAIQLDNEIELMFKNQLSRSINPISNYYSLIQPEIDVILRTLLWKYSIFDQNASFGQQLLTITYDKEKLSKLKLIVHYTLTIVTKYARDNVALRLTEVIALQQILSWIETILGCLSVVNFFRFLKSGRWPSIACYLTKMDHISLHGNKRRIIGYKHMTRELIWDGFMELLGFTVPLINYNALARKVKNIVYGNNTNVIETAKHDFKSGTKCPVCHEHPTLPYHMGCSHMFCYYCLKGSILGDENFTCPDCDFKNKVCAPVVNNMVEC